MSKHQHTHRLGAQTQICLSKAYKWHCAQQCLSIGIRDTPAHPPLPSCVNSMQRKMLDFWPNLHTFLGPSRQLHHLPPCASTRQVIKQRIQTSHIPPRHRHMVIATNLSSLFDLLHCSIPQTRTECCLDFAVVSGYGMFLGLSGSALPPLTEPVRRAMQRPPPISQYQKDKSNGFVADQTGAQTRVLWRVCVVYFGYATSPSPV